MANYLAESRSAERTESAVAMQFNIMSVAYLLRCGRGGVARRNPQGTRSLRRCLEIWQLCSRASRFIVYQLSLTAEARMLNLVSCAQTFQISLANMWRHVQRGRKARWRSLQASLKLALAPASLLCYQNRMR